MRNLPEETRRLRTILEQATRRDLCEVVLRPNATIDEILDVFQDPVYRNRITLFHFGGHANGYQLLLETAAGQPAAANAGGLAAFLGQQQALQLVFLNGCSTEAQVEALLTAGVALVIATAQAIDDAVATHFAGRFYQSLAGGSTVETAYNEAVAAVRTERGTQLRDFYAAHLDSQSNPQTQPDRFPWLLAQRPGAEIAAGWNLPAAAGDLLFGLPPLPTLDLPASPYRHLNWYTREHAEVFFGRSPEIRTLYARVTSADAAPIVLFYGQSGVGKSSLLAAGLLPRLEATYSVHYLRREQDKGLLGTLIASLLSLMPTVPADNLRAAWLAAEAHVGRPLLIVLD
ncbi:MAG: CHAT domain-containing protein, partial [Chloroflexota bacterium]|nr:CHAT domain-containing protein [Chloroflexota bacterium]